MLVPNRALSQRLSERGVTINGLTILFSQIRPPLRKDTEKRKQFIEKLEETLSDQNIAALIIAGLRLDEDAKVNLIPENPVNEYGRNFVLHKILQKAVMDYMSKDKQTSEHVRPDYLSSIFSEKLGWFSRSIISAVMHCVYANVFENRSEPQKE